MESSARAEHDLALQAEFARRGVDTSTVYDGTHISFAKRVTFVDNRLIVAEQGNTNTHRKSAIPSALGITDLFCFQRLVCKDKKGAATLQRLSRSLRMVAPRLEKDRNNYTLVMDSGISGIAPGCVHT